MLQKGSFLNRGIGGRPCTRIVFAASETAAFASSIRVLKRTKQGTDNNSTTDADAWTDEKNQKRCELVDKEISGNISPAEKDQLEQLQLEMLAYRRRIAPLPLEDLRMLHQELLNEVRDELE